jgi:hypothetical protein
MPRAVAQQSTRLALAHDRPACERVDAHAHENAAFDRWGCVRASELDQRIDDLLRQVPEAYLQLLVGQS